MNKKTSLAIACFTVTLLISAGFAPYAARTAHAHDAQGLLDAVIQGSHRSDANRARDQYRHPKETLLFFGLQPDMTVVEISPANGWYTEIIAPYVRDQGKFYAAHFSPNASLSYMAPNLRNFEAKMSSDPALYGKVTVRHLNPPHEIVIAPAESADMALTFRNVHNWVMADQQHEFFATFFAALKPGGILGIVEHRAKADAGMEVMRTSGYVTEAYVKELADYLEENNPDELNAIKTRLG